MFSFRIETYPYLKVDLSFLIVINFPCFLDGDLFILLVLCILPLSCLSCFQLYFLVTPSVSSNFSYTVFIDC
jgi:hypothetical protein